MERALRDAATHTARLLAASLVLDDDGPLARALGDELDLERERAVAFLAVRYGEAAMSDVAVGLAYSDHGRRGVAAELLQVTVSRADASIAIPMVVTTLGASERLDRLRRVVDVPDAGDVDLLHDLVSDPRQWWRSPWLQAVALHTAAARGLPTTTDWAATALHSTDPVVSETAASILG